MPVLKYTVAQLPGEQLYREFLNKIEAEVQNSYRYYQDWRMNLGISMQDIDAIIGDGNLESFNSMKNLEYDTINNVCRNYALLEMKHWRTNQEIIDRIINYSNPSKELATSANLPFFVIKYYPKQENGQWEFNVYPSNDCARIILPESTHMSERQFIKFLYGLRNKPVPIELLKAACAEKKSVNAI